MPTIATRRFASRSVTSSMPLNQIDQIKRRDVPRSIHTLSAVTRLPKDFKQSHHHRNSQNTMAPTTNKRFPMVFGGVLASLVGVFIYRRELLGDLENDRSKLWSKVDLKGAANIEEAKRKIAERSKQ